jgi:hypothetical protein
MAQSIEMFGTTVQLAGIKAEVALIGDGGVRTISIKIADNDGGEDTLYALTTAFAEADDEDILNLDVEGFNKSFDAFLEANGAVGV